MGYLNDALKKRNRRVAFDKGYEIGKQASSKADAKWWGTAGTTAGEFGMEKGQAFEDAVEQHEIIENGGDEDVEPEGDDDGTDIEGDGDENDEGDDGGSEDGGFSSPVDGND